MAPGAPTTDAPHMGKRILAAVLWLFAGWYLGNAIAFVLGVPDLLGPILGVASAFLFAVDPFDVIWNTKATTSREKALARLPEPVAAD